MYHNIISPGHRFRCSYLFTVILAIAASTASAQTVTPILDTLSSPGRCVSVNGDVSDPGTLISIFDCYQYADNQQFQFDITTGEITVTIQGGTPMCLNVSGDQTYPDHGTPVIIYWCGNYDNEVWTYNPSQHTITGLNGQCLDITDGGSANGTLIQIAPCVAGAANQQFSMFMTASGTPLPFWWADGWAGWSLKQADHFGMNGNIPDVPSLRAKYDEGQWWNVDSSGNVCDGQNCPYTQVGSLDENQNKICEQQAYTHFGLNNAIAFLSDHLSIQAIGQQTSIVSDPTCFDQKDYYIPSAMLVSRYNSNNNNRSFCVEARYTIPGVPHTFPAFWQYGNDQFTGDGSEIDVEQPAAFSDQSGNPNPFQVSMLNHSPNYDMSWLANGAGYYSPATDPNFSAGSSGTPVHNTGGLYSNPTVNYSAGPHYYATCYNDANGGPNPLLTRYIDGHLIYELVGWQWNASYMETNGQNYDGMHVGANASTTLNLAIGGAAWAGNVDDPKNFNNGNGGSVNMDIYSVEYYSN